MIKRKKGETSYKQTAFGIIPRSELIPKEIEGIKRAWDFVLQKNKDGRLLISPESLKKIHEVGFGWIFPEFGGKFRQIDVTVSNHLPPKFYQVPQLMLDFTDDLKIRIENLPKIDDAGFINELISLLAWTHHRFLWIHPFQDYNGRIGRLLINVILLKLNLPPIELKVETKLGRQKYIKALKTADQGEYSGLLKLIKSAFEEALKEVST
jgi:Fic family protein